MSGGDTNPTELVAALINQKDNLIDGLAYAQQRIEGSMTILLMTPKGIYAARDRLGRTPVSVGKRKMPAAFRSRALPTATWATRRNGSWVRVRLPLLPRRAHRRW